MSLSSANTSFFDRTSIFDSLERSYMEATVTYIAGMIPDAGSKIEEWTATVEHYLECPNEKSYGSVKSQGGELIRQIDTLPRYSYPYTCNGEVLLGRLNRLEMTMQVPYIVEAYRVRRIPAPEQLKHVSLMQRLMSWTKKESLSTREDEGKVPVRLDEDEFQRLVRAIVAIEKDVYPDLDMFRSLVRGIQPIIAQEQREEEKRLEEQEQTKERERLETMTLEAFERDSDVDGAEQQEMMSLQDLE